MFAATVLVILANVGQLTHNQVSRAIFMLRIKILDLNYMFSKPQDVHFVPEYGTDGKQNPTHEGLFPIYQWGMYNYCRKQQNKDSTVCSEKKFGHRVDPVDAIQADTPAKSSVYNDSILKANFHRLDDVRHYTNVAFYLLFVGTILAGVSWILSMLFHMAALAISALGSFLAFACLCSGAGIWTWAIQTMKHGYHPGVDIQHANAIWMFWSAVAATLFAIPFLLSSASMSRSMYIDVY